MTRFEFSARLLSGIRPGRHQCCGASERACPGPRPHRRPHATATCAHHGSSRPSHPDASDRSAWVWIVAGSARRHGRISGSSSGPSRSWPRCRAAPAARSVACEHRDRTFSEPGAELGLRSVRGHPRLPHSLEICPPIHAASERTLYGRDRPLPAIRLSVSSHAAYAQDRPGTALGTRSCNRRK
jgi:hypothetical protein